MVTGGLMVMLLVPGVPLAAADDDTSVVAEVEVVAEGTISYGASVVKSKSALLPILALGEPDGWGAFVFGNGQIIVELEDEVVDAGTVSVWMANNGWGFSNVTIYASPDGKNWTAAGQEIVVPRDFVRYDFNGSFGDVKYIHVDRKGGRLSWLLLDAVGAKGGDIPSQ